MFTWLKAWWDNTKWVIINQVCPAIDGVVPALADLIKKQGVPESVAKAAASEIAEWLKAYLKRQL